MEKGVKVSAIKRWGGQKKPKSLPGFLLSKEERERLRYRKLHFTGKSKKKK